MQLRLPWTLSFVREWWPRMSLLSVLRLRDYELRREGGTLRVELSTPLHIYRLVFTEFTQPTDCACDSNLELDLG